MHIPGYGERRNRINTHVNKANTKAIEVELIGYGCW